MNDRLELWLFVVQRITAAVLAPLVLVHVATMIYVVQGGLTAAEILSRTQGSLWWAGFYGLFVAAAAVHGSIGLRTIIREMAAWTGGSRRLAAGRLAAGVAAGVAASVAAGVFGLAILVLGFRAVSALT